MPLGQFSTFAFLRTGRHTYKHTGNQTYMHADIHIHTGMLHTNIHAGRQAVIHAGRQAMIQANIHSYMQADK